ncbi:hypothetical protein INR49_025467 [Caranx melampygus]|nr:hypothetical protein INR49_025467 [Caranx melampygus]
MEVWSCGPQCWLWKASAVPSTGNEGGGGGGDFFVEEGAEEEGAWLIDPRHNDRRFRPLSLTAD